ncbi:hypothetical protein B0H14DRAFT_2621144 [Mycena olivaceomarginata]|nr:hypothetical protein B0H14DRAFT_2621144 [Mycena olivaceomarginata]
MVLGSHQIGQHIPTTIPHGSAAGGTEGSPCENTGTCPRACRLQVQVAGKIRNNLDRGKEREAVGEWRWMVVVVAQERRHHCSMPLIAVFPMPSQFGHAMVPSFSCRFSEPLPHSYPHTASQLRSESIIATLSDAQATQAFRVCPPDTSSQIRRRSDGTVWSVLYPLNLIAMCPAVSPISTLGLRVYFLAQVRSRRVSTLPMRTRDDLFAVVLALLFLFQPVGSVSVASILPVRQVSSFLLGIKSAPAANTTSGRRIPDSGFPFVGTVRARQVLNRNRAIRLAISIRWKISPRDLNLAHRRIAPERIWISAAPHPIDARSPLHPPRSLASLIA